MMRVKIVGIRRTRRDADHAEPVTYDASSPTRNRTTSAISVASAIRPTGIWLTIIAAHRRVDAVEQRRVDPAGAHRVHPDAERGDLLGRRLREGDDGGLGRRVVRGRRPPARRPSTDEMLTTEPDRAGVMWRSAARVPWNVP